jgi:hypothetical protein
LEGLVFDLSRAECEKGIAGIYDANNEQWKGVGMLPAFTVSEHYLRSASTQDYYRTN